MIWNRAHISEACLHIWWEYKTVQPLRKTVGQFPRVKHTPTIWLIHSSLAKSAKASVHVKTYTWIFIAALFPIVKTGNTPRCQGKSLAELMLPRHPFFGQGASRDLPAVPGGPSLLPSGSWSDPVPSPAPAHGPSHYSTIKYSTIILEVELLGFHLLLRGPREFFPLHSRFQPQKEKYLRQRDFPKHPDFPLRRWQPSLVYGFRPTLPTPCK